MEQDPLWPPGSFHSTTPSSGLAIQHETNLIPTPMDPLDSIMGVPNDFDWVCK